jgi:2'-5' RNA ligase
LHAGDPREAIEFCREIAGRTDPFEIAVDSVEKFDFTEVLKLSVRQGADQLRRLHGELNAGPLLQEEKYSYEPHVTLAQDLPSEHVDDCLEKARASWQRFTSSTAFPLRALTFVQEGVGDAWSDLAFITLGNGSTRRSVLPNGDSS